jgi:hypothetical protein
LTDEFLFTVPSGEPVSVEPFHYAIVGQTQFSGKTTLIKRLAEWAVDLGFKVLIFDTKETEADYAGFGREVPVCLRESTDSFVLIGLLESMFRRRLTPYYATLSRITEGAKGFDDIIERARKLEEKTRSSWLKDACRVLYDLLERLKSETAKVDTIPKLRLHPGLNRMVINDFSLEAQQLIVKNSFEDLLRIYKRKAIGVLDEGHKFTPQGYSSPATRPIMHVMTQGGKTELFGWIATQFLAVTDKGPLKACAYKFLGTQDHITEIKHTLDLIPEIRGKFTSDDIMKLKLGHWILVRKRPSDVKIIYALPIGVPVHTGRKVAVTKLTPEYVRDKYLKPKLKEVNELVWKEKYEQLQRGFEKRVTEERDKAFKEAMQKVEKIKKQWNIEELQKTIVQLKDEKAELRKAYNITVRELKKLSDEAEALKTIKQALTLLVPEPSAPSGFEPGSDRNLTLQATTTILDVPDKEKAVMITTDTIRGKVLQLAKSGFLNKWQGLGDVHKGLIEQFGWTLAKASLQRELNRMVDDFLLGAKRDLGRKQRVYKLAANVAFKQKEVEA